MLGETKMKLKHLLLFSLLFPTFFFFVHGGGRSSIRPSKSTLEPKRWYKCQTNEACYDYRVNFTLSNLTTKLCPNNCVYYKCMIDGPTFSDSFDKKTEVFYRVKEGYGCYEDFVKACQQTGYQTKEQLINESMEMYYRNPKPNLPQGYRYQYVHSDKSLIFTTCITVSGHGCAKESLLYFQDHPKAVKSFGYQGSDHFAYDPNQCSHLRIPSIRLGFPSASWCKSGREFMKHPEFLIPGGEWKNCDPVISFYCTESGMTVKHGVGCLEDFVKACNINHSAEFYPKLIATHGSNFFHADKNVIVTSTTGMLAYQSFGSYVALNSRLTKSFFKNIKNKSDESCDDRAKVSLRPPPLHLPDDDEPHNYDCEKSEACYAYDFNYTKTPVFSTKSCDKACVYYKCVIGGVPRNIATRTLYDIKEGYGCYEDFVNACQYTGYQMKEKMKNSGKDYQYFDENLIYLSCSGNNCAKNTSDKMIKDKDVESVFGNQGQKTEFYMGCIPLFASFFSSFDTKAWCKSGRQFKANTTVKERASMTKHCKQVVSFYCTENGKMIKYGLGCLSDFEAGCKGIYNFNLIQNLKREGYNYFYADKNIIVLSYEEYNAEFRFEAFLKINSALTKPFFDNIDGNSDETCDYIKDYKKPQPDAIDRQPGEDSPPLPDSLSSSHGNSYQCFGSIIVFAMYYYIW